jgi:hypothetical protein
MVGYLVDVEHDNCGTVEIREGKHLEDMYRLIGCRCIDITVRRVSGRPYNIVCDDEGLLRDDPTVSAMGTDMRPQLVGNLLLFGIAPDMDTRSLTDEEMGEVDEAVREVIDFDRMQMHPVLMLDV